MRVSIGLVLAVAALLAGCGKKQEETAEAPAPVQVTSVTQATIRRIVRGDGTLFPLEQASVMPKVAAPVARFYVNRGDVVKAGQLLATLENRDLKAAEEESKAALEQAESNFRATQGATVPEAVEKARMDLEAARAARDSVKKVLDSRTKLLQQGALAQRQVDESAAAFAQAETQFNEAQEHLKALESVTNEEQIKGAAAQVASAKAHLVGQESQVAFTRIESPIAGVVADRPVNVGDIANPGMPLMTVMNTSRVIARINVPQGEAGVVKPGQPATVTQPDSKDEIEGKVTVVSPAADPNTTTVQVWIQIDNSGGKLKPGTAVHASIATEVFKAATVAPVAAILPGEEGGTAVLVVSADNVVHKRTVTLGVREGGQVQILSGANPGEEVVISGGMGLDDKAKVKIITTQVEETDDDEDQQGSAPPATDQKKDQAPKK